MRGSQASRQWPGGSHPTRRGPGSWHSGCTVLSSVPPIQLSLGLSPPPTPGGSVTSGSSSGPQGWSFTATKPRFSPQPQGVLPVDATHHSPVIQALLGGRLSHKYRDYLLHLWFIPSLELGLSSSWFPNSLSLTPACPQFHNSHCHADSTWGWNLHPR